MAKGDSQARGELRRTEKAGSRGSSKPLRKTAQDEPESRSSASGASPVGGSDRAWKVAQLAATLATRYVVHPGQSTTGATDDGDWTLARNEAARELDGFYLSLLRRAEFLLIQAEGRAGYIHAYQLFDPFRRYGVREITEEFRLAGWRGLTSENAVRALFAEIGSEMERRSRAQLENLLRFWLDPNYLPHRGAARLPKGGRLRIEIDLAALLKNPDTIKDDPNLPQEGKGQASLEISRHQMIRDALDLEVKKIGINPYAALCACCDGDVMNEKLWRRRADLNWQYPL